MNGSIDTSEREAGAYTPPPRTPIPLHDPDAILHRIEREVGHDHPHWGQVDPHELIRAVLKHANCVQPDQPAAGTLAYLCEAGGQRELIHASDFIADQYVFAGWKITPLTSCASQSTPPAGSVDFAAWRLVLAEKIDAYIQAQSEDEGGSDLDEVYGDLKAHILAVPVDQPQAEWGEITKIKQHPFAYFVWEPSRGKFSQVMPGAAGQPGVIAAYANPQSGV